MKHRSFKELANSLLRRFGFAIVRSENLAPTKLLYQQDGLVSWHNSAFMQEPAFRDAYSRGLKASQEIDPHHHWRVHVAIWSAGLALKVPGDFVECGVNAGFISSAIMQAHDWNAVGRNFFLVDSFAGPPLQQFTDEEIKNGLKGAAEDALSRGAYVTDLERIRLNFLEWPKSRLVIGNVPEVLEQVNTDAVAFLHLDMNAAYPECAALEHFWPVLSDGAVILFDDYAYMGYEVQKFAIDQKAKELGFCVLSLPTGQGLVVKGAR